MDMHLRWEELSAAINDPSEAQLITGGFRDRFDRTGYAAGNLFGYTREELRELTLLTPPPPSSVGDAKGLGELGDKPSPGGLKPLGEYIRYGR